MVTTTEEATVEVTVDGTDGTGTIDGGMVVEGIVYHDHREDHHADGDK